MPRVKIKRTGTVATISDLELAAWKKANIVDFEILEDTPKVEIPEVLKNNQLNKKGGTGGGAPDMNGLD